MLLFLMIPTKLTFTNSKYGVVLRELEHKYSKLFMWFFYWGKKIFDDDNIPFYDNFFFRNSKLRPHSRPSSLVSLAIQWWCGSHYKTTVQDIRYSVETYATKMLKTGKITESDKLLISEGDILMFVSNSNKLGSFHSDKIAQQSYNKPSLYEKDEPIQMSFKKLLNQADTNCGNHDKIFQQNDGHEGHESDNDDSDNNDDYGNGDGGNDDSDDDGSGDSDTKGNNNGNNGDTTNNGVGDSDNNVEPKKMTTTKKQQKRIKRSGYKKYM